MSQWNPVKYALLPAGGKGLRMARVSRGRPKELLRVGGQPAIWHALEEAVRAGLSSLVLVISHQKEDLRRSVEKRCASRFGSDVELIFLYQPEPLGLADAISLGREVTAENPFAILLPDNIVYGDDSLLSRMIATFTDTGKHLLAMLRTDSAQPSWLGPSGEVEVERLSETACRISDLHRCSEPISALGSSPSSYRTFGRYVCHPGIYSVIDSVRSSVQGEFDDEPVLHELIVQGELLGMLNSGVVFDIGQPEGLRRANRYLSNPPDFAI